VHAVVAGERLTNQFAAIRAVLAEAQQRLGIADRSDTGVLYERSNGQMHHLDQLGARVARTVRALPANQAASRHYHPEVLPVRAVVSVSKATSG
jgi:hypothetical protein